MSCEIVTKLKTGRRGHRSPCADRPIAIAMNEANVENDKLPGTFGRSLSYSSEDLKRDDMQVDEEKCKNETRPTKRDREEETEEEWTCVQKTKKEKIETPQIQVYISNKEKLPKQFALDKLFKEHDKSHVLRVKYLTPYRDRVDFEKKRVWQNYIIANILMKMGLNYKTR